MKNKLRKLKIDHSDYLYSITNTYQSQRRTNLLIIKIYLNGHKQTPLILHFLTKDDLLFGQKLITGANLPNLKDDSQILVNLNEPKYIREFLLAGQKNGWTGRNKVDVQDGLEYLINLGFDISSLRPETTSIKKKN